jgi:hypothetical protein
MGKQVCNIYQVEAKKFSAQTLDFIKSCVPQQKNYLLFPTTQQMNAPFVEDHRMMIGLFQALMAMGFTHLMILI